MLAGGSAAGTDAGAGCIELGFHVRRGEMD
jgi:hypothetical protein